jgi:hypothetical protein
MNDSRRHAQRLARLVRLRALREQAAARELRTRRDEAHARQQAVDASLARIDVLERDRRALVRWASGGGARDVARFEPLLRSRGALLDEDLARARHRLADERQALAQALQALDRARVAWRHAQARCDALAGLAREHARARVRQAEQQAEREVEPVTNPGALP